MKILTNSKDYDDYLDDGITLVDFFTEWCGPCRMLTPILEEIDYMKVLKIDADKFPDLAKKYGIMSVPTLLFYKNGLMIRKEIGYRTPEEIRNIYKEISAL